MAMIQDCIPHQQIQSETDNNPALTEQFHRHPDMVDSDQRVEQAETNISNIANGSDHAPGSCYTAWFCEGISDRAIVVRKGMNGQDRCDDGGEG